MPTLNPLTNLRALFVFESTENALRGWSYNFQKSSFTHGDY